MRIAIERRNPGVVRTGSAKLPISLACFAPGPERTRWLTWLSTLARKFGDVFGEHYAAWASAERAVLSLSISRRRSRWVKRQ